MRTDMRTSALATAVVAILVSAGVGATATQAPARVLPASAPASSGSMRSTRISYLAGGSVYLDAGQADGLDVGDTVEVTRGDATIARLRVTFVSSRRASCDTLWTRQPLALGDAALFRGDVKRQVAVQDSVRSATASADSIRTAAVLAPPRSRAAIRSARWRGRVGGRWLSVGTDGSNSYQQPGLELRMDGRDALSGHADVALDVRGRRTVSTSTSGTLTDQFSRVYRASTTFRDHDNRRRLTLGRQTSPTLASISLFDGALLEWSNDRRTVGAFGGTQPDPVRLAWSGELVEGGVFAEWHQPPLAARRWSVSTGGVTSRAGHDVNRDFLFAQGWWFSRGGSASLAQEVDVNSGWKRSMGEPPLSWTSTFATVRVPVTPQLALQSGYDNRRNVRLWRDRVTPETEFDDRYRQGTWAGATLELAQHVRGGAEYRNGSGGDRSDTWSVNAELYRITRWQASTHSRFSAFTSPGVQSQLVSLGVGVDPMPQSHFEFNVGTRSTRDVLSGINESERWQGVDLDLSLGARWYVNGGYELQQGLAGNTRQVQAGISVRL
jgi:hypothetical protein